MQNVKECKFGYAPSNLNRNILRFLLPIMRTRWVLSRIPNDGPILDVGFVGSRDPYLHMAIRNQSSPHVVIGLDIWQRGVRELGLDNTIVGDVFKLPFQDESFACVVMAEVIEHVHRPFEVLLEISRTLRSNGRLILTTPNPFHLWRWLKCWFFASMPISEKNVQAYLGDPDHKMLLDPLSVCNMITQCNLKIYELTTKKYQIPFLGRILEKPPVLDLSFYPFNRLGANLYILAIKDHNKD